MECDTWPTWLHLDIDKDTRTCYDRVVDDYNAQGPGKHSLKGALTQMEGACGSCKKIWGSSISRADAIEMVIDQDRLS